MWHQARFRQRRVHQLTCHGATQSSPRVALAGWRCCSGATFWLSWVGVSTPGFPLTKFVLPARQGSRWCGTLHFPLVQVMIWDDHQNMCIGELAFRSDVRNVKLRRDRVVVVLQNKLYVYNFADLNLLDHIETVDNPLGLCALCPDPFNTVLACPSLQQGHVRVELYDVRQQTLIPAHETALAALTLNSTGRRLATASEKGTLIRVFDTATGDLLQELRRGADKAVIYCIAYVLACGVGARLPALHCLLPPSLHRFSPDTKWLACTSDKGTVHIFKLNDAVVEGGKADAAGAPSAASSTAAAAVAAAPTTVKSATPPKTGASPAASEGGSAPAPAASTAGGAGGGAEAGAAATEEAPGNARSSFAFMRGLLPKYFSSEWSHAQFKLEETRALVAFGKGHTIVVVTAEGSFYVADFSAGATAERTTYSQFVKPSS